MNYFELASAIRGVVSDMHKRLRKQVYSIHTLSITEMTTVSYLYRQGTLYPSELADINKIKKQSMSQVLNNLEEQGFVKRSPSKEDKRMMAVTLTAAGRKMVEQSRYERDEWLADAIEKVVGEKDAKILQAAIPLLMKITNVE